MAYAHVAHDCVVGNNCILANGVQVAGHVTIEDYVIIGGLTPVHQFCIIGQHAMIGGGFRAVQDVPPYILAASEPLKYSGLNVIGLRRRGFANEDIFTLKKVYTYIYNSSLNLTQAKEKIINEFGEHPLVKNVLAFLEKSKRGIIGK
jgi:UDP-N-acetylglucosamine acyltransferase